MAASHSTAQVDSPAMSVTPLPPLGRERMQFLREFTVPPNSIASWFLGQNGFILKDPGGTVVAIDPYLTNSCSEQNPGHPLNLNRLLASPLEPEELDVDFIVFTHSHDDHLDLETIRRLTCAPIFAGPWETIEKLKTLGLPKERHILLHPRQSVSLNEIRLEGTFALPTDATDLNHMGVLFTLPGGLRFYNTGDTAFAHALSRLLPTRVDICAICINGGFHNLSHGDAAQIVKVIEPLIAIPTHFDLMACNQSDPEMFRFALLNENSSAIYQRLTTDRLFLYERKTA